MSLAIAEPNTNIRASTGAVELKVRCRSTKVGRRRLQISAETGEQSAAWATQAVEAAPPTPDEDDLKFPSSLHVALPATVHNSNVSLQPESTTLADSGYHWTKNDIDDGDVDCESVPNLGLDKSVHMFS